jgi:hypothetical protein
MNWLNIQFPWSKPTPKPQDLCEAGEFTYLPHSRYTDTMTARLADSIRQPFQNYMSSIEQIICVNGGIAGNNAKYLQSNIAKAKDALDMYVSAKAELNNPMGAYRTLPNGIKEKVNESHFTNEASKAYKEYEKYKKAADTILIKYGYTIDQEAGFVKKK